MFGHLSRLTENCPAKQAPNEALKPSRKPRGRPKITWIETVSKQLKTFGIDNIFDAIEYARDKIVAKISEHYLTC